MSRNTVLVILVSLLLVVGFAYFFVSPKFGPQVEISRDEDSAVADPDIVIDDGSSNEEDENLAIEQAKQDLQDTQDVDLESIEVVSVEQQDFGDSSLGCPKEGEFYAQVITPGYQILLLSDGIEYDYRVSKDGSNIVLCSE